MSISTIYILKFSLLVAFSVIVLRVFVRRDYLQRGHLSIGTSILQAAVFFAFGGYPVIYLPRDWPNSHVNQIVQSAGWICITIGLVVIFAAMFRLGFLRSLGLQSDKLEETRFYRSSRNPQVVGCVLYVIGFVILWPSVYAFFWAAALMVILHVMVLTEEEHLHRIFPEDYEQYCGSVHRYLGYPKKLE